MPIEFVVSDMVKDSNYLEKVRVGCKKIPKGKVFRFVEFMRTFCNINQYHVMAKVRNDKEFAKYQGWVWGGAGRGNEQFYWGRPEDIALLKQKGVLRCLKG
jgi:hypothetical protein